MPDEGSKKRYPIKALAELHIAQASGIVRFEKATAKKQLVIHLGEIVFAESNLPDEHLARILVEMKRISRLDLPRITALMKTGKKVDEALLATQKIDQNGIEEGMVEQTVRIVASVFAWEVCDVRFYPGDELIKRKVKLQIPIPHALLLSARRAAAERKLPRHYSELAGIVSQARETPLELSLNNIEAFLYSQALEPIDVEDLLSLLPAEPAKTQEALLALLMLGLLRLEPRLHAVPGQGCVDEPLARRVEEMLGRYEVADHYEILGIPSDADEEVIRAAYHELAKQLHPDRFQSAEYSTQVRKRVEQLFTYITGAYRTLSDVTARSSYDEMRIQKHSKVQAAIQARTAVDLEKEKMAETLFKAGRNSLARGEYDEAVAHFKECVWLRPDLARFHHYLGVAESEVPQLRKDAEQCLLKAIELDQAATQSHLALGKLYSKVNLPRRAEAQFAEVLRWDPDHPEARKLLALSTNAKT